MPNINIKTYVDVHTTGKRREFSSLRQYDRFLKAHKSYVINKKDAERLSRPMPYKKMDTKELKDLAEKSWAERHRYIPQIKERILKQQYEKRNGGING